MPASGKILHSRILPSHPWDYFILCFNFILCYIFTISMEDTESPKGPIFYWGIVVSIKKKCYIK